MSQVLQTFQPSFARPVQHEMNPTERPGVGSNALFEA
jgi:hypothetical protein